MLTKAEDPSFTLVNSVRISLEGGRELFLQEDWRVYVCSTISSNKKALFVKCVSGGSTGYASGKVLKYSPPSLAQQDFALAKAVQHFSCNCRSPTAALLVRNQRVLRGNWL